MIDQELIFAIGCWVLYMSNIHSNVMPKVARNIASVTHASLVVMIYMFSISKRTTEMFYISCGYYLVDTVLEINQYIEHKKMSSVGLIMHHITSCYVLQYLLDDIVSPYVFFPFFIMELSNFPVYLTYHIKIVGYIDNYILKLSTYLEIITFVVLRMVVGNYNLYVAYVSGVVPMDALICAGCICGISFVWLCGFIIQISNMDKKTKMI